MALPNTSAGNGGFTLIEVAVVSGIFAAIVGFGLMIGSDALGQHAFRMEKENLLSVLRRARGRAMRGVGQAAYGIHYAADGACRFSRRCYVLFAGTAFDPASPSNSEIASDESVTVVWPDVDPAFRQLDGGAVPVTVKLVQRRMSAMITVNDEGQIDER